MLMTKGGRASQDFDCRVVADVYKNQERVVGHEREASKRNRDERREVSAYSFPPQKKIENNHYLSSLSPNIIVCTSRPYFLTSFFLATLSDSRAPSSTFPPTRSSHNHPHTACSQPPSPVFSLINSCPLFLSVRRPSSAHLRPHLASLSPPSFTL